MVCRVPQMDYGAQQTVYGVHQATTIIMYNQLLLTEENRKYKLLDVCSIFYVRKLMNI